MLGEPSLACHARHLRAHASPASRPSGMGGLPRRLRERASPVFRSGCTTHVEMKSRGHGSPGSAPTSAHSRRPERERDRDDVHPSSRRRFSAGPPARGAGPRPTDSAHDRATQLDQPVDRARTPVPVRAAGAEHARPEIATVASAKNLGVADALALRRSALPRFVAPTTRRSLTHLAPRAVAARAARSRWRRRRRGRWDTVCVGATQLRRPRSSGLARAGSIDAPAFGVRERNRLLARAAVQVWATRAGRARVEGLTVASAVRDRVAGASARADAAPVGGAARNAPADAAARTIGARGASPPVAHDRLVPRRHAELGVRCDRLSELVAGP
jgi:hypothetical protein